jgi:anti-sigma factor RsiW
MKNHNCSEIFELLSPYIDKELGIDEEKAVAQHIESCSECQKEYTELLELKKLMEEISKEEIQAPERI